MDATECVVMCKAVDCSLNVQVLSDLKTKMISLIAAIKPTKGEEKTRHLVLDQEVGRIAEGLKHRLNMEIDLQSLFGLHVT